MIRFSLKPIEPTKLEVDVLITFIFEDELSLQNLNSDPIHALFKEACIAEDFHGKKGDVLTLSTKGTIGAYKICVIGLGKKGKFSVWDIQDAIACSIRKTREMRPSKIACILPKAWIEEFPQKALIQSFVEAVSLSAYRFLRYKGVDEKPVREIEEAILYVHPSKVSAAGQGLEEGIISTEATLFARDLINEPAALTTPTYLATVAKDLAKASKGSVKVTVLEEAEIKKLGMNSFLGVAKGSDDPPKFIVLSYKGKKAKKKIALVGKGITFDTGGLSLKPAEHMETMKLDMSGAAAVLGVFWALPKLNPDVEVVGVIAACENMPSGKAIKPGDIVKAMNGKTIEVLNTDAEGRLTLADAFSYVLQKEKPDQMIDLATLTGACMVALGSDIAGLWGNNDSLLSSLEKSAQLTGEKIWRMPLEESYRPLIKSHIADVKNIQTGRYGGAITAALFLLEFVGTTPWAHLDIAGPAFAEKDMPLTPLGGVGFGVRMLLHYLQEVR